jgi:monoamine oxidase
VATPDRSGPNVLGRRRWLKLAAAPLVGAIAGCGAGEASPAAGSRPSVVVVGGGLCGLQTLRLLRERGFAATLVEGWSRLGGRVFTVQEGGLRIEMGAERIAPDDVRVRNLAAEAGVPLVAFPAPDRPTPLRFGALRTTLDAPAPEISDGLSETERRFGPLLVHLALTEHAAAPALEDPRTALRWLKDLGLGAKGEALVRAFSYHDVDRLPAATFFRFAQRERAALTGDCVSGGTRRLVDFLAEKLRPHVEQGFVVESAKETAEGVELVARDGKRRTAALAVFAMSPAAALRVEFAGGLPAPFAERLSALAMGDELKISAIVPGAAAKAVGYSAADRFPRATWPLPERAADGSFVLNTMAVREDLPTARAAAAGGPIALASFMNSALPEATPFAPRWFTHDWRHDPLAGGAYAFAKSPAGLRTGPVRAGRFILAGGDFSTRPGWMEGALESAAHVAELLST